MEPVLHRNGEQCSCFLRQSEQCSKTRALITIQGGSPWTPTSSSEPDRSARPPHVDCWPPATTSASSPGAEAALRRPSGSAADAADAARLSELADGAVAVYNCVNPHLLPLGAGLAARGCSAACGRRVERRRAGDRRQPLRLRPGRRADDRADTAGRDRPQGPRPHRDVARRPRRARGRTDPDLRGAGQRLPRRQLDAVLRRDARLCGRVGGRSCPPTSTRRTRGPAPRTSPRSSSPACTTSGPGAAPGTCPATTRSASGS